MLRHWACVVLNASRVNAASRIRSLSASRIYGILVAIWPLGVVGVSKHFTA